MNARDKELAVEADFMLCEDGHFYSEGQSQKITDQLQKFADLIRADEREACAKFLERIDLGNLLPNMALHYALLINSLVSGIRARGNT